MTNTANREVCDCVFLDYKTKKPVLFIDYANTTTQEVTGNTVYAYGGKGHPRRIAFQGEKEGTITIETQLRSFQLYSFLTGAAIEKTAKFIRRETLTVGADGAVTLAAPALNGTAFFFKEDDDCCTALTATGSGDAYTLTGVTEGSKVIAYYWIEKSAGVQTLNIKSTTFPGTFIFQGDTYDKAEDGSIVPYLYIAHKCAPQPTFSLSQANTGDPVSLTITCDLMADENNDMLTMTEILEEDVTSL